MKIGILTFHRAENFGAALQVYALQSYLKSNGFQVYVMDYRCKHIELEYHIFNPKIMFTRRNVFVTFMKYIKRFLTLKDRLQKKNRYRLFRNFFLNLTKEIKGYDDILDFDTYIVGSDQVWSLSITKGIDDFYFLNFPIKKGAKKIAYAASSEIYSYALFYQHRKVISKLLESFNNISVREETLKTELEQYVSTEISVCIDPTFLLSRSQYCKIAKYPKEKKYVLVYHMLENQDAVKLAESIAKERGLSIIEIHAEFHINKDRNRHKYNLGPLEILGYIINADSVITTSFHGIALSIIMHKEFWTVATNGNLRQCNLLRKFELLDRLVCGSIDINTSIDFERVDKLIYCFQNEASQYIYKSLEVVK